jgi:hypothetical protein
MAFTTSPELQTYTTQRVPAAYGIDLRPNSVAYTTTTASITTDAGMINLIPIKDKDPVTGKETLSAFTRPALVGQTIDAAYTGHTPRGVYVWEKDSNHTYYFVVYGQRVYSSSNGTSWTNVQTIGNSDEGVSFTEYINDTATKSLILCDGSTKMYQFTSNAAPTTINLGFNSIPSVVYLDGYLFTVKDDTGDIYNCNLNDPTTWSAGDFISSELYPDDVKALVKISNYLLAVGTQGCEYFYDAANPTGSPLARQQELSLPFGAAFPTTMAANKNSCVFLANNNDGEICLKVIESTKVTEIPAGWLMEYFSAKVGSSGHGADYIIPCRGYFLRLRGNPIYVLALQPYLNSGFAASDYTNWIGSPTFGFDFATGMWFELQITVGGVQYPFPVYMSAPSRRDISTNYVTGVAFAAAATSPVCFFAKFSESTSSAATDAVTNYFTSNIAVEMRTPSLDFGSLNQKTMYRLGTKIYPALTGASVSTLAVQWSDNDYNSWSTAVNVTITNSTNFPFIYQLGQFRQRAFKITYSGTSRLLFKELEFELNRGIN